MTKTNKPNQSVERKPTKEEYFRKRAVEHQRKYRTFFERLSEWEKEFVKEYEGIDGHSGLYTEPLLDLVNKRVSQAIQAERERVVEEIKIDKAKRATWFEGKPDTIQKDSGKTDEFLRGVVQGWNNCVDELNEKLSKTNHKSLNKK